MSLLYAIRLTGVASWVILSPYVVAQAQTAAQAPLQPVWRERYEQLKKEERARFVPPKIGATIRVLPKVGPEHIGVLRALTEREVTVDRKLFQGDKLSDESRRNLFADFYASELAKKQVLAEKAASEETHRQEAQVQAAAQEERRATLMKEARAIELSRLMALTAPKPFTISPGGSIKPSLKPEAQLVFDFAYAFGSAKAFAKSVGFVHQGVTNLLEVSDSAHRLEFGIDPVSGKGTVSFGSLCAAGYKDERPIEVSFPRDLNTSSSDRRVLYWKEQPFVILLNGLEAGRFTSTADYNKGGLETNVTP